MRFYRFVCAIVLVASGASYVWADRVIMKDGKTYDGHIMGETEWNLLLSNPLEAHARFIAKKDILTIVREDHTPPPPFDPQRYLSVETSIGGSFFTSRALRLSPSASLNAEAGIRLHPLIEVGTNFSWTPQASGGLSVGDGETLLRSYEQFWMYDGGFWTRLFPFASRHWIIEPYLFGGFQWDRLLAKGTDDFLKGNTWRFGVGAERVIHGSFYGDARILFNRARFDAGQFLNLSGDLSSSIPNDSVAVLLGVSYHLD